MFISTKIPKMKNDNLVSTNTTSPEINNYNIN